MFEVEVKFRVSDLNTVEPIVRGFAAFLEEDIEEDHYFQHPCRDFSKTDEALRVRVYGNGRVTVTYKGPRVRGPGKARVEYNIDVEPLEEALNALKALGFVEVAVIRKRRRIYTFGSYTIYLDSVEGLGNFVEVETMVSDESLVSRAMGEVIEFAKSRLGLGEALIEPRTYLELALGKVS